MNKASLEQGRIDGLMEREKVVVPQFVANWIETCKENNIISLSGAFEYAKEEVEAWFSSWENQDIFARAWLDGYEVDKEPKYTVKFKATKQYLSNDEIGIHFDPSFRSNFRKSDLEKLGLAEVFNSPLFEVEEVTK